MSSTWGNQLKISVFGESHSLGIGVVVDGLPAGQAIDMEEIHSFMARRSSRGGKLDTPRIEKDLPIIQSGLFDGFTCGTPICAVIQNSNTHSSDYGDMKHLARPGHADYTGHIKYNGYNDVRGGGHFSGRLTAPLVFAGGLCKQILRRQGVEIGAHIASIGGILDKSLDPVSITAEQLLKLQELFFPVLDFEAGENMQEAITEARSRLDSIGGVIECAVTGLPAGIGEPMFDSVESKISQLAFGIPAIKGIEFGAGFSIAHMKGSQANDTFFISDNKVKTRTNNNGGILGGITTGMPLIFRLAVKPTPSISQPQDTVDFILNKDAKIEVHGRHDPCIVRRAVPCAEAIAAIALVELMICSGRLN